MNIAKSKILQLTEKYATSSHINFIVRRIFFFIIIGTMAMLFSFTSMPHKRLADEREDFVAQNEDSVVSESGKTKCARFEKRNVQKSGKTKRSKNFAHTTL